ncbi:hypothetical protein [Tengunoibacter tsumagoiensis]|uniref:Adhesin domain-containing protein n=1 Tax=Tengunoibacter tsumagoiensis TaxID=2014871 RepID=A0A401ZUQ4_9CHLR|nr:hypothetical protein [Tengunoibacter tsumagoiensis]GCE10655.1 hypothetical protein KTT_05140 [Tengunoibacter tsumagoiensis]
MSFTDPYRQASSRYGFVPERRFRRRRLNIGCILLLLLIVGIPVLTLLPFIPGWSIGPTTISTSAQPLLIVNSSRYEKIDLPLIRIHVGSDPQKIVVQKISQNPIHLPWSMGIDGFQQNSDHSIIILNGDPVTDSILDIAMPANSDLNVDTNAARIDVTGLTGHLNLSSNSGSITLTHCHLSGASLIADNTGLLTIKDSALNGAATIYNNTGSIVFQGSIGSSGIYSFESNTGSIDATLSKQNSFHLNVFNNTGTNSSTDPGVNVQGKEAHLNVGTDPEAQVTFKDNTGNITISTQTGA